MIFSSVDFFSKFLYVHPNEKWCLRNMVVIQIQGSESMTKKVFHIHYAQRFLSMCINKLVEVEFFILDDISQ